MILVFVGEMSATILKQNSVYQLLISVKYTSFCAFSSTHNVNKNNGTGKKMTQAEVRILNNYSLKSR